MINTYVAKNIGEEFVCLTSDEYQGVREIGSNNSSDESEFSVKPLDEPMVSGNLCPTLLKREKDCTISHKSFLSVETYYCKPCKRIINRIICECRFPDSLKHVRGSLIFEKKDLIEFQIIDQ